MSTPVDPLPTATQSSDHFNSALEFTRLIYTDKYIRAATMVEANSPAARYIDHRTADDKAQRIDGQDVVSDEDDWTFDGDRKTGKIRIEPSDGSAVYTWKQFTFDGAGKIRAWTGASGPIESVLWTRESRDSGLGATARLVSAYRTNAGSVRIVVEFSSKRDVGLSYGATYTARGGYRQNATDQSSQNELNKGEKALTYYSFADATFRGTLRLKVASAHGVKTAELVLAIR